MNDFDKYLSQIGNKIKEARLKLELTQVQAAELIGVEPRRLQEIEYGKANITLKTFFEIQKKLSFKNFFIGEPIEFEDYLVCCMTDLDGRILWTNSKWKNFARENNGPIDAEGLNYFDQIKFAISQSDPSSNILFNKLNDLLEGNIVEFTLDYPCHSSDEARWFSLFCKRVNLDTIIFIHFRYK